MQKHFGILKDTYPFGLRNKSSLPLRTTQSKRDSSGDNPYVACQKLSMYQFSSYLLSALAISIYEYVYRSYTYIYIYTQNMKNREDHQVVVRRWMLRQVESAPEGSPEKAENLLFLLG